MLSGNSKRSIVFLFKYLTISEQSTGSSPILFFVSRNPSRLYIFKNSRPSAEFQRKMVVKSVGFWTYYMDRLWSPERFPLGAGIIMKYNILYLLHISTLFQSWHMSCSYHCQNTNNVAVRMAQKSHKSFK